MSRRPLRPEEARLWAVVARTVRRTRPEPASAPEPEAELTPAPLAHPAAAPAMSLAPPRPTRPLATADALAALAAAGVGQVRGDRPPLRPGAAPVGLQPIEPNRKRRIARAREPIGARLDLHGLDQDRARAALHAFVLRAHAEGVRAVLVITGKGRDGGGVLRARAPEWLAEPPSGSAVAGVSAAEPRHGGEGALYVALKRREPPGHT